jgi:hypothetical protein
MTEPAGERLAPASFIQRSMWAAAQRHRAAPLNVMILPWRVRGPLQADVLHLALGDLVARHPTLRTRLRVDAGQLFQEVLEPGPVELTTHDIAGDDPAQQWQAAVDLLRAQGRQPLDLAQGTVFRPWLVRLSAQDHVLCLFVHHAMCDGWSSLVLMDDLAASYAARLQGNAAVLPPLVEQYADHAAAQFAMHEAGGYAAQIAYWQKELADPPPPIALPTIAPRKGNRDWMAHSPLLQAPAATLEALRQTSRARRVSVFSTLLAALAVLLHRHTGAVDQIIGVPILGRWSPAAMRFVGCATNMLPARIRLQPDMRFDLLAAEVHGTVRRLLAYGRVPLELVLREIQGPVVGSLPFPIWCQFREATPPVVLQDVGLSFTPFVIERGTLLTELDVDMLGGPEGLDCEFAYRPGLFGADMVGALMYDYAALLAVLPQAFDDTVDALCTRAGLSQGAG